MQRVLLSDMVSPEALEIPSWRPVRVGDRIKASPPHSCVSRLAPASRQAHSLQPTANESSARKSNHLSLPRPSYPYKSKCIAKRRPLRNKGLAGGNNYHRVGHAFGFRGKLIPCCARLRIWTICDIKPTLSGF